MRSLFFDKLKDLIRRDKSIFFLTGDTGFNLVESMLNEIPERALNVGVAEQNMIGIASGLVNVGYVPVCYAITNFLVERSFEQIRNDICLHEYKVILVGTSTGYDNGALGATHHKLDDIGALKVLPNLRIYSPSSYSSVSVIFKEAFEARHASFIRIPKVGIQEEIKALSSNHFIRKTKSSTLVISHGKMVGNSLAAHNISPVFSLFAMDRIKPLEDSLLFSLFDEYETIIVIEDNFRSGLYNSLCQWSIEKKASHSSIFSISPDESYDEIMGNAEFLENIHDLSADKINKRVIEIINNK
jgi:transketolase|tara:strand:- start:4355 stop:5254 length:900 start_codon:yes stop_codon:yes gene_type:complete